MPSPEEFERVVRAAVLYDAAERELTKAENAARAAVQLLPEVVAATHAGERLAEAFTELAESNELTKEWSVADVLRAGHEGRRRLGKRAMEEEDALDLLEMIDPDTRQQYAAERKAQIAEFNAAWDTPPEGVG